MKRPDLAAELAAFFSGAAGAKVKVDASTPLLEWGLLDSVRILELADFLKERAGYRLEASALSKENFKDIRSIVRLVGKKPAKRGA